MTINNDATTKSQASTRENAPGASAETQEVQVPPISDHLVPLKDPQWALWRWVGLRGAGFPASQVLQLAMPGSVAIVDQLIQADSDLQQMIRNLGGEQEVGPQGSLEEIIRAIKNAGKSSLAMKQSRVHDVQMLRTAILQRRKLRSAFLERFRKEVLQVSQAIQHIASTERFREAVTWQNRQAVHGSIASLLRVPPDGSNRTSKRRKQELLVARYLQRYCTKNDTIGFFGPVGWATFTSSQDAIVVKPGPQLLIARNVYFEEWCLDALAHVLAKDKALRPWWIPRLLPHLHLHADAIHIPFASPQLLNQAQRAVLSACDGFRTAREVAQVLLSASLAHIKSEEQVYSILEQFVATSRIAWTLEIPLIGPYPEEYLRHQIERIDDDRLRAGCLEKLDILVRARDAVSDAAGDAERLDEALGELDAIFTRLTGEAPTRHPGQNYAGRTLVYEDCRRDIEVELGTEVLSTLGDPLSLLLTSARWLTSRVAELYRKAFLETYTRLAQKLGTTTIDFATFWLWIQPLFHNEKEWLSNDLVPLFQEKWAEIFAFSEEQLQTCHQLNYTYAELVTRVQSTFGIPAGAGWQSARYQCPDVLLEASSPEAIRRGDYRFVLGELHIQHTVDSYVFLFQHPKPQDMLQHVATDLPQPRFLPVYSRESYPVTRLRPALITPKDLRLMLSSDTAFLPGQTSLPIGSLVVELNEGAVVVRPRDAERCYDCVEVCAEFLTNIISTCFQMLCPRRHLPRIAIDHLVVIRESWSFASVEIPFLDVESPDERFIAAHRWQRQHAMPRCAFVKVPGELKPCFLDFSSSLYIDMFVKMVRRARETGMATSDHPIVVSEMLPDLQHLWLQDAEAHSYASELRIVAIDQSSVSALPHGDLPTGEDSLSTFCL